MERVYFGNYSPAKQLLKIYESNSEDLTEDIDIVLERSNMMRDELKRAKLFANRIEKLGVVDLETSERDGKAMVTHCRINAHILAQMATEFHIVEHRYGERWELGSWDPEVLVPD